MENLANKYKTIFLGKPSQTLLKLSPRSSRPEVFSGKGVLKIYSKFTGGHSWRSAISVGLLCKFIEIAIWHECSSLNLLYIFRTPFPKDTSGRLLPFSRILEFPISLFWSLSKAYSESSEPRNIGSTLEIA